MSRGLIKEAKIMEMLTMTGSRHFPQIYGRVHRDVGQQDRVLIDEKRREVHRIFMEFCEEGSFAGLIDDCVKMGDEPDEATLWSYFHCLAKANMVLESGHEQESETPNSDSEPWAEGKLVIHFDLKPDNVLMGGPENDGEHMKENRIMIADFGLSVPLPNKQTALEKDRITILNEHAWRGTRAYKAPEQENKIARASQRYGSHTNIYQVGLIMWCIIMQKVYDIPYSDSPEFTNLTGPSKKQATMGAGQLETEDQYSETLRGLVAECLIMSPASRPTSVELLKRTRAGLATVHADAAAGSKTNENLTVPSALLLDRWWGQQPGVVWPDRIPEMQKVVALHEQQLEQVKSAKAYTPTQLRGSPPVSDDQPEAPPAAGTTNAPPEAPPATGTSGTGQGPKPDSKNDIIPRVKSWPRGKFSKPIDLLNEAPPDKAKSPPVSGGPAKPVWNNAFEDLRRRLLGAHVPRPQKRPSQEPDGGSGSKRSRMKPAPIRTIDKVNNWFRNVNLNSTNPPPTPEGPNFIVPVRIWPGPSASPVDESAAMLRIIRVPAKATLNTLIALLTMDPSTGVGVSWGVWFCRPGTTVKLSNFTTIAELGYEPVPSLRGPYLECFRKMTPPSGSFSTLFDVEVCIQSGGSPTQKAMSVKLRAREDTTIFKLKEVIINHGYRADFKSPEQLRIHLGGMGGVDGADLDAGDCPNRRTVKSFFSDGVDAKVWCCLRPQGQVGAGRGRTVSSQRRFTPPVRTHRRFI
ncbi:hypothetical protein V495_05423 [Pseudogymnoascus sp. VKM F-4514 (FW-929)]|nr:hypothetical protein V495_05423 [Pseudogymnoascus sp. VKM F-4514 (FW-929)]